MGQRRSISYYATQKHAYGCVCPSSGPSFDMTTITPLPPLSIRQGKTAFVITRVARALGNSYHEVGEVMAEAADDVLFLFLVFLEVVG